MSIELNPVELGFRRPFTQQVTQALRLRNPGYSPIAFKVKTTAPKQYCVRPNSGRIESGQVIEVQVILQAMKEDPPPDAKCRDKFLVQAIAISPDKEASNLTTLWSYVEQNARASIQEKKIRVSYLPAVDDNSLLTPVSKMNGTRDTTPNSDPPPYSTPSSTSKSAKGGDDDTPTKFTHPPPIGPVSVPASRPANNHHLGEARASAFNPAMDGSDNKTQTEHDEPGYQSATSKITSSVSGIKDAVPTSTEELKARLAEAQAQIASLTGRLTGGGGESNDDGSNNSGELRKRTVADKAHEVKESVMNTAVQSKQQLQQRMPDNAAAAAGIAVPVVAALCLVSFLLGYIFF